MSIEDAERAFAAGNFAEARRLAKALGKEGEPILARTGVDPLVVWMTAGSALLFLLIVLLFH